MRNVFTLGFDSVRGGTRTLTTLRPKGPKMDLKSEDGKMAAYRAGVKVSFKYMGKEA